MSTSSVCCLTLLHVPPPPALLLPLTLPQTHVKHRFSDTDAKGQATCKFLCHTFWATQFRVSRQRFAFPFSGQAVVTFGWCRHLFPLVSCHTGLRFYRAEEGSAFAPRCSSISIECDFATGRSTVFGLLLFRLRAACLRYGYHLVILKLLACGALYHSSDNQYRPSARLPSFLLFFRFRRGTALQAVRRCYFAEQKGTGAPASPDLEDEDTYDEMEQGYVSFPFLKLFYGNILFARVVLA